MYLALASKHDAEEPLQNDKDLGIAIPVQN